MFETFIVQPIFNLLLFLYAQIGDFGTAIILFTIIIRIFLWPLMRKQLHQSRKIQSLQPELKKIKEQHKDDRQAQSAAMMELYKEHEVNPVGPIGLLIVQLPVLFGLFSALRALIDDPSRILRLPYDFLASNDRVVTIHESIADKTTNAIQSLPDGVEKSQLIQQFGETVEPSELVNLSGETLKTLFTETLTTTVDGAQELLVQGPFFDKELFGIVDLTNPAFSSAGIYIPVLIIAILAGVFQFIQTKQINPQRKSTKSIRQIMSEAAKSGKEPDQSEISAAMGRNMGYFFGPLIAIFSATAPAGLALYFATGGLVGMIQQRFIFRQDVEEMEEVASSESKDGIKRKTLESSTKPKNKSKSKKKNSSSKSKKRRK